MNDTHEVSDERYIFKPETRSKLFMLLGAGIFLFAVGVYMAMSAASSLGAGTAMLATRSLLMAADACSTAPGAS